MDFHIMSGLSELNQDWRMCRHLHRMALYSVIKLKVLDQVKLEYRIKGTSVSFFEHEFLSMTLFKDLAKNENDCNSS